MNRVRFDVADEPGERKTELGFKLPSPPTGGLATNARFTVPLKPPTLVRVMVDVLGPSTSKHVGLAAMLKSGPGF